MTAYELRKKYKEHNPDGHYFDEQTLRFFGESMADMKVAKELETVKDYRGNEHQCYVLTSYQRNHPDGARWATHYFDSQTFDYLPI